MKKTKVLKRTKNTVCVNFLKFWISTQRSFCEHKNILIAKIEFATLNTYFVWFSTLSGDESYFHLNKQSYLDLFSECCTYSDPFCTKYNHLKHNDLADNF